MLFADYILAVGRVVHCKANYRFTESSAAELTVQFWFTLVKTGNVFPPAVEEPFLFSWTLPSVLTDKKAAHLFFVCFCGSKLWFKVGTVKVTSPQCSKAQGQGRVGWTIVLPWCKIFGSFHFGSFLAFSNLLILWISYMDGSLGLRGKFRYNPACQEIFFQA